MEPLTESTSLREGRDLPPEKPAAQDARGFAQKEGRGLEGDSSQSRKEPPERWGEFFTRTGAGPGGRGVGGKGIKRHPSSGEDVTTRGSARFSPPARGFGSSRGFPRAQSPDDLFPSSENLSRKGRSVVPDRSSADIRSRRNAASNGVSGSHSTAKVDKHAAADSRGLWPLVVGLQGEAQGSWSAQERPTQKPVDSLRGAASREPPLTSEWSNWLEERSRQLSKDDPESGDNESHSSDDICFGPVQRRRLSEDIDLPDIAAQEGPPGGGSFSFSPPGFGASPSPQRPQNPQTLAPSSSSLDNNLFPTPFSFSSPPEGGQNVPSTVMSMDTDSPPGFSDPPPRHQRAAREFTHALMPDHEEDYMPSLLAPPAMEHPPNPPPHFGLPPPVPRNHFLVHRRGPVGSPFNPPTAPASSRGPRNTGPPGRPPSAGGLSWLQNRGSGWEVFSEDAAQRHRQLVSDGGRPFVDDGVGAMFSHAQAPPFELLPVPTEAGEQTLGEPNPPPYIHQAAPPDLFDNLDPLRQLRRLSPGERPQDAYPESFENGSPLLHRARAPPRLEAHTSPPRERSNRAAPPPRSSDLFDWDAYEEQADVDWWDAHIHSGGGGPERRARSPPRRTSDPGLSWLEEPIWESGAESLDEGGAGQRQNPPGSAERTAPVRRRRFSLFDDEAGSGRAARDPLLLDAEAPASRSSRGGEQEQRAARNRGRSWLRDLSTLEGGAAARASARAGREPGVPSAEASRSVREGLFALRRGGGPLGPPPRPETEAVLGRPPVYRNLREFLSEAGGPPAVVRRTPAVSEAPASESAVAGRGYAAHFRGVEEEGEGAVGRARARRHRARMFEAGREGIPAPLLAMLSALEEAEQFQDLTGDQLIRLQIALTGGEMAARRRRELDAMRVDVDRMTYEELLELEERIGNVSVGLSPETVVEKLPITKWQAPAGDASEKEIKCVVCQLEYEDSEDVRILPCKHCYHADCIKSWLATKNECPVCKAKAVP